VSHHLFLFRAGLFLALLVPSLSCLRGNASPDCGCQGCDDFGDATLPVDEPEPETDDDDDDDDDATDDDDAVVEFDLTAGLPVCENGVLRELTTAALDAPQAGSGDYAKEAEDLLENVRTSFSDLMDRLPEVAVVNAGLVDYELCRGEGEETGLGLWRPEERGTGAARVVFRSLDAAPLVVGVPRPSPAALEAALAVFEGVQARVLIVGATDPCAAREESPCAGTTRACSQDGSEETPLVSDMARWDRSVFHVAHEFFAGEHPDDRVLTLVEFEGDGMTISDGTTAAVGPTSAVALMAATFASRLPDEDATACNPDLALPYEERECGEANLQGRLLNLPEGATTCNEAPDAGAGRYVHIAAAVELLGADTPLVAPIEAALP
jgi:hypothetical protein